jgi:hypothetical protein
MRFLVAFLFLFVVQSGFLQDKAKGDDQGKGWPAECKKVEIVSSADHTIQPAYFYRAKSNQQYPLVVRLHQWSSDCTKVDGAAQLCIDNDYNYIYPDFRGPNNRPEACGSPLVIQDIEDAIDYAISPPPYASDDKLIEKYKGGSERIAWLFPRLKKITENEGCRFIDIYSKLLPLRDNVSKDGIHLTAPGQKIIADIVSKEDLYN